jgi:hypothetical protein
MNSKESEGRVESVLEFYKADINHEEQIAISINLTYNALSNRLPHLGGFLKFVIDKSYILIKTINLVY